MTPARRAAPSSSSRYKVPRPGRSAITRRGLLDRLHQNMGSGLTAIQAPSGFGKTTLLADFAAELDYETRWLTLDSSCCAPEILAHQLALAVTGGESGWPPPTSCDEPELTGYLRSAIHAATEAAELPLLIVLDNVHELCGSPVAALLGVAIGAASEGPELVLSGRELPELPALDRRLASGEHLVLGSVDLAFSGEEVDAIMAARSGPGPTVDEVMAATDGWPVGVMAVLSEMVKLSGEPGLRRPAWDRYLASEIWQAVPARLGRTLSRLSLAAVIDPALASSVVGEDEWQPLRAWLNQHDFLCEQLPGDAVRLNPLLRDFVQLRFRHSSPRGFAGAVKSIARYLELTGAPAEAIQLASGTGKASLAVELIKAHHTRLLREGASRVLEGAFAAIPRQRVVRDPLLRAIHARTCAETAAAAQAIEDARGVLDAPDPPAAARVQALLALVRALRMLGRTEELRELRPELRLAAKGQGADIAAEMAWQEALIALAGHADFATGEARLHDSIRLSRRAGATIVELFARSTLAQIYAMRGDGPAAVEELTHAAAGWRRLRGSSHLAMVLNNLGMALQLVGDHRAAVEVLLEAQEVARKTQHDRYEAYSTASLGDAHLLLGEFGTARRLYEQAIELASSTVVDDSLKNQATAGLAYALLGLGDAQGAYLAIQRAMGNAARLGNPLELGTCLLTQSTVEAEMGQLELAIKSASQALGLFEEVRAEPWQRAAHYRLARWLFRSGRRTKAERQLARLGLLLKEPWMARALLPLLREDTRFAEWAASRREVGAPYRILLERPATPPGGEIESARFPAVVATSLGRIRVTVGGRAVADEGWESNRAKELFFLFLAHRDGLRKDTAVEMLYPGLTPSRCNSAFHSNLYRLRRALYGDSIVKRDGAYILNPEGSFSWDVDVFEDALARARAARNPDERAAAFESALDAYHGPFAEEFGSDWGRGLRARLQAAYLQALSALSGHHSSAGRFEAAAACLERTLAVDPYNEDIAYHLALYRSRAGHPGVALRFIEQYRQSVADELGEPLPDRFRRLQQQIASQTAAG